MKKDVIYIDTEDDITAIIDKVKHSPSQIVALVPPKRVGVLQSTVNLKLLQRAAERAGKRPVLITSDPALTALAGGLALPIARNLQSKPEIASLDSLESEGEEVIHGEDMAIGELAKMGSDKSMSSPKSYEENEDSAVISAGLAASAIDDEIEKPKPVREVGAKVPDFNRFRKKLFVLGGLGVFFVGFMIWALFFAGKATIAITAKTNIVNVNKTLQLKTSGLLDVNQAVLPVVTKQIKKTASVDFTPTGTKEVGEKAAGTVKIKTDSTTILVSGLTVPTGTAVQATNGLIYNTTAPAVFVKGDAGGLSGVIVGVVATASGSKYNNATGKATTSATDVDSVVFATSPSGGTDKKLTVVSVDDIAKATEQLKAQDANIVKGELTKQFGADEIVISEAYIVEPGSPVSTPLVDQEATAGKITLETTYTLLGIKRDDLKSVYNAYLATHLKGDSSQKVYKPGDEKTQFSSFEKVEGGYSVRAIGMAQVGPNVDSTKVTRDASGKQTGEVKQSLESIQGIDKVDITLSPFWVTRVPNDAKRVTVTFVLKND